MSNDPKTLVDYGVEMPTETGVSRLVDECARLCRVPIGRFTVEDFRIMIGQGLGLEFLVQPAMTLLKPNILAEGDFYPGDLLKSLLTMDPAFWKTHPDLHRELEQLYLTGKESLLSIEQWSAYPDSLKASYILAKDVPSMRVEMKETFEELDPLFKTFQQNI